MNFIRSCQQFNQGTAMIKLIHLYTFYLYMGPTLGRVVSEVTKKVADRVNVFYFSVALIIQSYIGVTSFLHWRPWFQTQTHSDSDSDSDSDKFIQQKKIQVQYQVYITFMNIQLIISPWHINDYKHVGRLPLRSYLTADMEATRKGEACTAVMKTAMQLIVN